MNGNSFGSICLHLAVHYFESLTEPLLFLSLLNKDIPGLSGTSITTELRNCIFKLELNFVPGFLLVKSGIKFHNFLKYLLQICVHILLFVHTFISYFCICQTLCLSANSMSIYVYLCLDSMSICIFCICQTLPWVQISIPMHSPPLGRYYQNKPDLRG